MLISLIGTGFIMPRHAEAIQHAGGRIAKVYNTFAGEESWKEVLSDQRVEGVVILTPNDLHVPMAQAAARAGKRVLCEKPLGISSESVQRLLPLEGISTVLQLRHHPLAQELRELGATSRKKRIEMDITVRRDEAYFASWKGDPNRSGGILFNIGIHYFDMLQYAFGAPTQFATEYATAYDMCGTMSAPGYECAWRITTLRGSGSGAGRCFRVDGKDYDFSTKDNLSQENLHRHVYREFFAGRGVSPKEALASVHLVESLYASTDTSS